MAEKIKAGVLGGPHGVRGWVKVLSHTDPRENIFTYSPWWLQVGKSWKKIELVEAREQGKGFIVKLAGIDDCEAAREYTNCDIAIEADQLPTLNEGEFYWRDLIGLDVVNQDDVRFGQVSHLLETGANDVIVVKGDRERLVPYIDDVVMSVDLEAQLISVNWDADF